MQKKIFRESQDEGEENEKLCQVSKSATDDGYVKTINEEVWESFSENESEPSKAGN